MINYHILLTKYTTDSQHHASVNSLWWHMSRFEQMVVRRTVHSGERLKVTHQSVKGYIACTYDIIHMRYSSINEKTITQSSCSFFTYTFSLLNSLNRSRHSIAEHKSSSFFSRVNSREANRLSSSWHGHVSVAPTIVRSSSSISNSVSFSLLEADRWDGEFLVRFDGGPSPDALFFLLMLISG